MRINSQLRISLDGAVRAGGGGIGWPPSITSSDGETASLVDNGDDTVDVVINSVTVGTITRAQVEAGGFITVVEPVVGMSGNNVVLTTTGYVIHVGSTPIETDVEVLANTTVVGTALPFDATAYPDALLTVRFSYSTGAATLTNTVTARLAPLKLVQFRDSVVQLSTIWPTGLRTRKATFAVSFNEIAGSASGYYSVNVLDARRAADGTIPTRVAAAPGVNSPNFTIPSSGTLRRISYLLIIDLDGGLPSGNTMMLYASVNGAAPTLISQSTLTGVGNINPGNFIFGSQHSNTIGPSFDLNNHLWVANESIDPTIAWGLFYENNGAVKDLGLTGVVNGITPVIYMVGNDLLTGANRGSGGGVAPRARTPVIVVNA